MNKNIIIKDDYVIIQIETLQDLEAFAKTRKYLDYEISMFWKAYARGEKVNFALTKTEFKKFYL